METIEDGAEESFPISSFSKIQYPHSGFGIEIQVFMNRN